METIVSAVAVIDKAMAIIAAVESEPRNLAGLMSDTGLTRATAHRLAQSLEVHGMLRRDADGRFVLGYRLLTLATEVKMALPWIETARPALAKLVEITGESVQLFVRDGNERVCVTSIESPHGLRTIVPTGAVLPLEFGSGGRVLGGKDLTAGGWIISVGEREAGVASVSAPVVVDGIRIAAVSVSGPIERMTADPGMRFGTQTVTAALSISNDASR